MGRDPRGILKEYWGYDAFRPLQAEIIDAVLQGRDALALLPTGGGKSVCFQVPGMALDGLTLVISPLIALMRDQVTQLNQRHIAATFINSSLSFRDIDRKLQHALDGKYKFLYLAPERLRTEIFQVRLPRMNVQLIAVDEAHCVSQWGYDFRPSYLQIASLREILPQVPMIALTATAPPRVRDDIVAQLGLQAPAVFQQSFRRDNLSYRVLASERIPDRIMQFLRNTPGPGIIYARTRKRTKALADLLQRNGFSAAAYHGGMPNKARNQVQADWIANKTRIITATNAFGMGIDKPDVRFVMHYNLPSDPESYYQEAGRAGRDGEPAIAIAFRNEKDIEELTRWVREKYPAWNQLTAHYEVLCNAFGVTQQGFAQGRQVFDVAKIVRNFNVHPLRFYNSVRLLHNEGFVMLEERPDDYGYLRVAVPPRDVLAYKERFPDHAYLIDFALRTLGGELYRETMRFSPLAWSHQLAMEPEALHTHLDQLARRNIFRYRAPVNHPTITFLRPRQKLRKVDLNWEKYDFLRARSELRLEALLDYAEVPPQTCRSRTLETYFGEKVTSDCGRCDYCRQKAVGKLTPALQARIRAALLAQLAAQELEIRVLLAGIAEGTPAQRLEVLRGMLDDRSLLLSDGTRVRAPGQ